MAPLAVQRLAEEDINGEGSPAVKASVAFFMTMTSSFAAQTALLNKLPNKLKGTTVPFAFAIAVACSYYKQLSPPKVRHMAE